MARRDVAQVADSVATAASVVANAPCFERIVHRSEAMRVVIEQCRRVAATSCTVLVIGESGSGKELIADAVHHNSRRSSGPYQIVNMAAIPVTLVESELFGHRRGSFTGAVESRTGLFEQANGGTLFIDEIGDFELASQAKLLRVLETRRFTPLGDTIERHADVRVVAATSRNLEEMLANGTFRKDLFYRLNVVTIYLPALRERRDDILFLARHFLKLICAEQRLETLDMDPSLCEFMEQFDWPGNVRQLRNCIESMVIMAREQTLTMDDIPVSIFRRYERRTTPDTWENTGTIDDLEKCAIDQQLKFHSGNRTRAARSLGISVRTLRRRLNGR